MVGWCGRGRHISPASGQRDETFAMGRDREEAAACRLGESVFDPSDALRVRGRLKLHAARHAQRERDVRDGRVGDEIASFQRKSMLVAIRAGRAGLQRPARDDGRQPEDRLGEPRERAAKLRLRKSVNLPRLPHGNQQVAFAQSGRQHCGEHGNLLILAQGAARPIPMRRGRANGPVHPQTNALDTPFGVGSCTPRE